MLIKRIIGIIRCVIFLVIAAGSLYFINRFLEPKYTFATSNWPSTSTYNQFYEMEKNSVDVLFFGSSVCVNAFNPQELYNTYGIRSYNLGSEQQSIFISYYWLKEALKYQTPGAVVLDTRFLFTQHETEAINTVESLTRKAFDPMRFSSDKWEAIQEICKMDENQDPLSYVFTNLRFHTRWEVLSELDLDLSESSSAPLKGHSPLADYGPTSFVTYDHGGSLEMAEPNEIMQNYLDKIVALCKENHIALILLTIPGNQMNDGIHNYLSTYANTNGIDYYNFVETEQFNDLKATLPRENVTFHMNLWGSIRMTDYMGELLRNKYNIPSVPDQQYEESKEFYEHVKTACDFPHINDLEQYLRHIKDQDFTILISTLPGDKNFARVSNQVRTAFHNLGLEFNVNTADNNYCGMASLGENPASSLDEKEATLRGSFRNGLSTYSITSTDTTKKTVSSIMIDGVEYSLNQEGINVVVYDNQRNCIVDRKCFSDF